MSGMEQEHPLDGINSEHLRSLDEFDGTRSVFYDWLANVAVDPTGITTENIEMREYVDDLSTAFVELAVSCRAEAPDLDTAKADIAELWKQDDHERIEMFTALAEEGKFAAMSKDEFEQVVDSIFADSEDDQELAQNIREMYHGYVMGDVVNFIGCVQYRGEEQPPADENEEEVLLEIDLSEVIKRTRGVASFAIAVGLGMVIGKKLLR